MFLNTTFSSIGLQSVIGGAAQRTMGALALAFTLGSSGCVGDDSAVLSPVAPSGPAPLNSVASTDMAGQPDGCQYGTATYTLQRTDRAFGVIVAAQTSCPAGYFIEGSCNPLFSYDGGPQRSYRSPLLAGICFNSRLTSDQNIDPCQVGALVCAVSAPGDETETTTNYGGDGQESTSTDTIYGPDRIDLDLLFRCCPNP